MDHDEHVLSLVERFGQSARMQTLVTSDVMEGGDDVRLVYHDPDGGWWFTADDREGEEFVIACLGCVLERHPEVVQLADLPLNWVAHRDDSATEWAREPRPAEWGEWEQDDDA